MQMFGVLTTSTILVPNTRTITHFLGGLNFLSTQGVGSRHMTAVGGIANWHDAGRNKRAVT